MRKTNLFVKQKAGFTLIELLVVIAIIGLLASVVLVALNGARVKARDAKRISDLKQIANALALFYDQNGGYPATGSLTATSTGPVIINSRSDTPSSSPEYWGNLSAALSPYISSVPVDPINVPSGEFPFSVTTPPGYAGWSVNSLYHYRSNGTAGGSDASHYLLCAWLEDHTNPNSLQYSDMADPFTPGNLLHANDGYSGYNYCVGQ